MNSSSIPQRIASRFTNYIIKTQIGYQKILHNKHEEVSALRRSTAIVLLVLANLFWAGNYICGKYVITAMEPIQINFLRWLIAATILFPLAQFIEKPDWKAILREWKVLLILSVLGIIGYNILLYDALYFTTSLDAALINSVNPAMIAIFAAWLLKEKLSKVNVLGLVVSLVGVLLVLTHGNLLRGLCCMRTCFRQADSRYFAEVPI